MRYGAKEELREAVSWRESRQRERAEWDKRGEREEGGDSEREGACPWEMEILHNLKWFPLPSFLHPVVSALSLPLSSHATNWETVSVFNTGPSVKLRT